MCGIAGIFGEARDAAVRSACLETLRRKLKHRGPDDDGVWEHPFKLAGLVHTRLSILDTSSAGHQPMRSQDGRLVITFNGEIYNFRELRRELEDEGVAFQSGTDTEVILRLYERHGAACVERLRGMFAFAIWDGKERRGFLARDRFGMKPLYLAETGGTVAFASEVKALQAAGLCGDELDATALALFFETGSVAEPQSLLKSVRCLPAGHFIEWHEGRSREACYWQPSFAAPLCDEAETARIVREALIDSVQNHLVSDVPLGVFLSGGVDSTVILSLARGVSGQALRTFSIGVDDSALDESAAARRTAAHFGARHCELRLDGVSAAEIFERYLSAMDQPGIDGFNSLAISELASRQGMKAVLSGLGGDELFGGYASFRHLPVLLGAARMAERTGGAGRWIGARLEHFGPLPKWRRIGGMLQRAPGLHAAQNAMRGIFSPRESRRLAAFYAGISEGEVTVSLPEMPGTQPTLGDEISAMELGYYMRNQMLKDSDVMSMACGLELRLPFVDHRLLGEIARVPSATRLRAGKKLLLEAAGDLPPWVIGATKRGFAFPFERWMTTHWRERFQAETRAKGPVRQENWYQRWAVFAFEHWSGAMGKGSAKSPARTPRAESRVPDVAAQEGLTGHVPSPGRRLVFVSNLFPDSTAPYFGLDNATVLHELRRLHGWEVSVICLRPTLSPSRLGRREGGWTCREGDAVLRPDYVSVPYVPRVGSRVNHLLIAARLGPLLRSMAGEFDVVLASWLYPDGCAAVRAASDAGRPCVLITQGSDTHQYMRNSVRRRLILEAIARSRGVIARSRDLAGTLARAGAAEDKLHPIYNGVDLSVFRPRPKAEMRAELSLPADACIALFVGNFLDVKNPLMLVRAFAGFVKTQPEKRNLLLMAGRGPLQGEVARLAASLGVADAIVQTGPLDSTQIARHMAAADFLCLSSRNEGLPNVILESFACGLPVLSTDVGGIAEVVNHPTLGHLVSSQEADAFSRAISDMAVTHRDRDVIARVGAQFSWDNAAAAYDKVLTAALPDAAASRSG